MSWFGTIYADGELSHRAKAVYMYLCDRSDAEGKCWPGIKTIAAELPKCWRRNTRFAMACLL